MATRELAKGLQVRGIRQPRRRRVPAGTIIRHAIIIFFLLVVLLPFIWVVLRSVTTIPAAYQAGLFPSQFDFTHYAYVFQRIPTVPRNILNSVMVTVGTVAVTTTCAILAGYALAYLRFWGRGVLLSLLVASMFFPTRVTAIIAIFEIQDKLGLIDNTLGLILPYSTLMLALSAFVMRGVFEQLPRELDDAARIDGCGPWKTLWYVMLPLLRNGLIVVIMLSFMTAWGEFLLALTLMNSELSRTAPVMLARATGGFGQWEWPRISAVYVIVVAPAIVIFGLVQRWFIRGLQEGGLKF